jgi:hypothetical protein
MTDFIIESVVPVIIGIIIGFGLTWANNFWIERNLRRKYSSVFSFELQTLKQDLDRAIARYDTMVSQMQSLAEEGLDIQDVQDQIDIVEPNEVLRYYDFKSRFTFLNKNFEKISMFNEETIKSIIKINSLMEEYDALSKGNEKVILAGNLKTIAKEIQTTIDNLKKEGSRI